MALSKRAQRGQLRERLLRAGASYPEIADEMCRQFRVRRRTGWRYALGWEMWKVAQEYTVANPGARVDVPQISRWESWPFGGSRPSIESLSSLGLTFGHGCTVADLVDHDDREHLSQAELTVINATGRRQTVRPLAALGTSVPAARVVSPPVTLSTSPHAAAMESFRTADRRFGGGQMYAAVLDYLNSSLARDLLSVADPHGSSAFTAAAALSEMAGWMAHDGGDDTVAQRHFARAIHLATVDGDAQVTAHVLGSAAHLALLRADPGHASVLTARGLHAARDTAMPGTLRARLLGMQARAAAALGHHRQVLGALSAAETEVQRAGTTPLSTWVSTFDGASLAMDAARGLLTTGDITGAREQAEHVIALRPADRTRSRALAQLILAKTMLESSRPEEAAVLAAQVLTATAHLGSGVIVAQLRSLAQRMSQPEHGRIAQDVAQRIKRETQWRTSVLEGPTP